MSTVSNNTSNKPSNTTSTNNIKNIPSLNTNSINNFSNFTNYTNQVVSPKNANSNNNVINSINNINKPKQEVNKIYLPNNYNILYKSNSPEGRSQLGNNNINVNSTNNILRNLNQNSPTNYANQNIVYSNTNININNNIKISPNINSNIQLNTNNIANLNNINTSNNIANNTNNNYYSVTNTEINNQNNNAGGAYADHKKTNNIPSSTIEKKGLNIIPLKNLNNQREQSPNNYTSNLANNNNNERPYMDRFSPKPKDVRIPNSNISPKNNYMIPSSTKNVTEKINFDNKFGNRIYTTNININNKSPSPKHMDFISRLTKKSPDTKK